MIVNYSRSESEAADTTAEAEKLGARVSNIRCDVSADSNVCKMIDQIAQTFGRLDALVNNAGMTKFFEHNDLEAMTERTLGPNSRCQFEGPVFVIRAAADLLRAVDGGQALH